MTIFQFRTWQANPTKLLGFVNRHISMDGEEKFKYIHHSDKKQSSYNMLGGAAIFYHRFYQYVSEVTRTKSNKINIQEVLFFSNILIFSQVKSVPKWRNSSTAKTSSSMQ